MNGILVGQINMLKHKKKPNFTPKDAREAHYHALNVIKGRWKEGEDIIKTDPESALAYAQDIIKGRWKEGEDIIKTDPESAVCYAIEMIKGRWKIAEEFIKTDPVSSYYYAQIVIKGQLPQDMHNSMIAHGIIDPKNKYVKTYLKSKKYKRKVK